MSELKGAHRATVNRDAFEQLTILAQVLPEAWDFAKKFRVVLEHDPEKSNVTVTYSPEELQ